MVNPFGRVGCFMIALCVSLGGYPVASCAQSLPADVTQIVQSAVERDPRLLEARSGVDASGARIRAAKAGYLPTLQLQSQANRNDRWGDVTSVDIDEDRGVTNALRLDWNLFRGGADRAHVSETMEDQEAKEASLRETRVEVLRELAVSLLDYRMYGALVVSASRYEDQTRIFAERQRQSANLGQSSGLEVERALARNEEGVQMLQRFAALRDAAASVLKERFDLPVGQLFSSLPDLSRLSQGTISSPEDAALCETSQWADSPLIVQREAELAARRDQIRVAHAEYSPRVDLELSRVYGHQVYGGLGGGLSEKRAEIVLTIPLFDGHTRAGVQEAAALAGEAQAVLDNARRDRIVDINTVCMQWHAIQRSAISAEEAWRRTERINAALEREGQLGFKNSFDPLDASRDQFFASREFVEQAYEARRLWMQLHLAQADGNNDDHYIGLIATLVNSL